MKKLLLFTFAMWRDVTLLPRTAPGLVAPSHSQSIWWGRQHSPPSCMPSQVPSLLVHCSAHLVHKNVHSFLVLVCSASSLFVVARDLCLPDRNGLNARFRNLQQTLLLISSFGHQLLWTVYRDVMISHKSLRLSNRCLLRPKQRRSGSSMKRNKAHGPIATQ